MIISDAPKRPPAWPRIGCRSSSRASAPRRAARPDYLPQLQQELLAVIARYEKIDLQEVGVRIDSSGGCEVLEINIVLPDAAQAGKALKITSSAGASPS